MCIRDSGIAAAQRSGRTPSLRGSDRNLRPSGRGHLTQASGGDVEDEATHGVPVRDERAGNDPGDRLADVVGRVREGLGGPRWPDAGLRLDRGPELVVGEGEHPAVGVVDEHDLPGTCLLYTSDAADDLTRVD